MDLARFNVDRNSSSVHWLFWGAMLQNDHGCLQCFNSEFIPIPDSKHVLKSLSFSPHNEFQELSWES